MFMRINELPGFLDQELNYPVARSAVIEQIGDIELESPTDERRATISTSLERLNEGSYHNSEELFHAIVGTVSDQYIGRKYYDDRGSNPASGTEFPALDSF